MANILVAEDETAVRQVVVRALAVAGHEAKAVEDGMQALDALAADDYDLLLTDIVMPGLDGIALALKASAAYPHMRILMMSGYAAERQRAHNIEALVHRMIAKPFTIRELTTAVSETLEAGVASGGVMADSLATRRTAPSLRG